MGSFSIWHWLIVLVIVLLLFGAGKIPRLMGDLAKGVKEFKKGMKDEEKDVAERKSLGDGSATTTPAADKDPAAKS